MPRFDLRCPKCNGQAIIYMEHGDSVCDEALECDSCPEDTMMKVEAFYADTASEVSELQSKVSYLEERLAILEQRVKRGHSERH